MARVLRGLLGVSAFAACMLAATGTSPTCEFKPDVKIYDCKGRSPKLTQVPTDIPVNVSFLWLQGNAITTVRSDDFADLKHLYTLDLSNNNITVVEAGAFDAQWASKYQGTATNLLAFENLLMAGNPSTCSLTLGAKVQCSCAGSATGNSAFCAAATEPATTATTAASTTSAAADTATPTPPLTPPNTAGPATTPEPASSSTTAPAATTLPPPSKSGWTELTDKGCCVSVVGQPYDTYTYKDVSRAGCKKLCAAEDKCRGIEYPWDNSGDSGMCNVLMDDGEAPGPVFNLRDLGATGTGVVTTMNRLCRIEYQCFQLCRTGDGGACLITSSVLGSFSRMNSTLHMNTVEVLLDGNEQQISEYVVLDYAVFKAHTINLLCKYGEGLNQAGQAFCTSNLLITVAHSWTSVNGTTFRFTAERRNDVSVVGYEEVVQALSVAKVAGPNSGYRYPIKAFAHALVATTTTTAAPASSSLVAGPTSVPATAQASTNPANTTTALPSKEADSKDDFERNLAIMGVCAAALFLCCMIGYMWQRVREMKDLIQTAANAPGPNPMPLVHEGIERELAETTANIRMLEQQRSHYASLQPAASPVYGTGAHNSASALNPIDMLPTSTTNLADVINFPSQHGQPSPAAYAPAMQPTQARPSPPKTMIFDMETGSMQMSAPKPAAIDRLQLPGAGVDNGRATPISLNSNQNAALIDDPLSETMLVSHGLGENRWSQTTLSNAAKSRPASEDLSTMDVNALLR